MWDSRILTTSNHVQVVTLEVNFLFTSYYFSYSLDTLLFVKKKEKKKKKFGVIFES